MSKKEERISPITLNLLLSEYIMDQLANVSPKYPLNTINSDMYLFSRKQGNNIMQRVSDGSINRTHDQLAVLKQISNEFWRFITGKPGEEIKSNGPSHIYFQDRDIELYTRVSASAAKGAKEKEKQDQYKELVRIFQSGLIEGAINQIGYRSNVKVAFQGNYTIVEVYCF